MAEFKINVVLDGAEKTVSTIGEINKAFKQTREELKNVEVGSDVFNKLTEQARTLQNELKDVKEATNFDVNLAQTGESVARLGSTVASAFAIATSSIELFGGKGEEVSKAQAKAQQALAVAISATTIATNAAKFSEDARRAGLLLTTGVQKLTILLAGEQAVATAATAVANGKATIAQLALNAAMNANPIILLVSLLVAAGAAYLAFADDTEEAKEAQEALNKEIEKNLKQYKETQDIISNFYENEIKVLKAREGATKEVYEAERKEIQRKIDALQGEVDITGKVSAEKVKTERNLKAQLEVLDIEFEKGNKERQKKASEDFQKGVQDRLKAEEVFQKGRRDLAISLENQLNQKIKEVRLANAEDDFEKLKINGEAELKELQDANTKAVGEINKRYAEYAKARKISGEELKKLNEQEEKEIATTNQTYADIKTATNAKYAADSANLEKKLTEDSAAEIKQRAKDQEDILQTLEDRKLQLAVDTSTGEQKILAESALRRREIERGAAEEIKAIKEKFGTDPRVVDLEKEVINRKNEEIKLAEKATADEIAAYRIQKLQEYADVAGQIANSILAVASAITEGEKIESQNRINNARDAAAEQTNSLNAEYQNQVVALQQQKAQGLITEQQYAAGVKGLETKLAGDRKAIAVKQRDFETAEKKKAFETDKKLKIAQAIVAGAQGALSAFAGSMVLGPIAGPIVGGILAAAVVAATGVQIANIRKTQFDAGAPEIQEPQIPDTSSSSNTNTGQSPASMPPQTSTGGFTGFQPGLTGPQTGTVTGGNTSPATEGGPVKVVVLESDITAAQRRVSVAEANATF